MRRLLNALVIAAATLLAGRQEITAQALTLQEAAGGLLASPSQTTVYVAKEFITMDPKKPRAQAVAVKDGRFLAVGTLAEVRSIAGNGAKLDETFANKIVLAGFVEQHVHPVLAALTMVTKVISIEDWDAIDGFSPAVRDEKTYQAKLKQAITTHPDKSKPFITWGYHHYFHGTMSRALLDSLAPDFPVIVWHRSCHEFYLNSVALKQAGIDEAFVGKFKPSEAQQTDLAKGYFYEQGALAILSKIAPILATPDRFRKGLEFSENYYLRNGITIACEPGGFFSKPLQDMINSVHSDDATPFNHYFMADGKTFAAMKPGDPKAMIAATRQVENWGSGRTRYLPRQVKLLSDGAIYSQLMMMKDGYTDGHHGAWIMDPPMFGYAFQSYWDAGFQIHVHNNGDAGMDVVLDNLEKAMTRNPRKDHRTVLVHFGFATPAQVARAARLGAIVSANPYYVTALAGRYKDFGVGAARSENMVPLGEVVKNRMSFSYHSDMPMAPAKPLQLIWAAVNRNTAEGPVAGPQHKVSLEASLRAMTIEAAYSIQLENEVGSIEAGKFANLTILEKSPFEVAPDALKDIAVWGTMLEGRIQKAPAQSASGAGPGGAVSANEGEVQRAAAEHLKRLLSQTHDH
jgi:hypothetical protein